MTLAPRRIEASLFFSASLPALALYVLTLAPTVTAEDSGELVTAAATLGVAHPPGYPLWCILGKLFTFLPVGTVAFRVNLLSAVLGAVAVGILALVSWRCVRRFVPSLAGALVYAASRDFWSQSVIAEVYTLNVLIVLLLVWFVLRYRDSHRSEWLYLAAATCGLGLTNHSTIGPLIPLFLLWAVVTDSAPFRRPVFLLNLALACLLGFSIILYLPLRSAADPPMDWGNPETASATVEHLLRRQYAQRAREAPPRTVSHQATLSWEYLHTWRDQGTLPVLALSALGAVVLFRRRRRDALFLLGLFGMTSYGFIFLLNDPADREHLWLTRVFFLPAHAVASVWLAAALTVVGDALARCAPPRRVAALGSVALLPLFSNFAQNDRSGDYLAEDWGRAILESLPAGAVIIPSADHSTFPTIYLQAVEGLRPDVVIANKYGGIDDAAFRRLLDEGERPRVPPPIDGTEWEKESWLVRSSGRPVYATSIAQIGKEDPGVVLDPWGIVFRARLASKRPRGDEEREAEGKEHRALWQKTERLLLPSTRDREPGDFGVDLILCDWHQARARWALERGQREDALEAFSQAARHGLGIAGIQNNIGGALAEAGEYDAALGYFQHARELQPGYDLPVRNTANALFALGRYETGLPWFREALRQVPGDRTMRLGIARAYRAAGRKTEARGVYLALLREDRRGGELRDEVQEFLEEAFGEEEAVKRGLLASAPARKGSRTPREGGLPERAAPEPPATPVPTARPPDPGANAGRWPSVFRHSGATPLSPGNEPGGQ